MKLYIALAATVLLAGCVEPEAEAPTSKAPAVEPTATTRQARSVPLDVFSSNDRQQHAQLLNVMAGGQPAFEGLPNPDLTSCAITGEPEVCAYEQWEFLDSWRGAHAGDYGDQRNVAFCLTQGCEGVARNEVQGCAWRWVIITAAAPEMGDGDVRNFETDCGRLSDAGRAAAEAQGARIRGIIAERT